VLARSGAVWPGAVFNAFPRITDMKLKPKYLIRKEKEKGRIEIGKVSSHTGT